MQNDIINRLISVPFVEGGSDYSGMDCWGFVREYFKLNTPSVILPNINIHCGIADSEQIGVFVNRYKSNFIKVSTEVFPSIIVIKYNDPIYANHVGVFLGGNKFIHTRRKVGVSIDSIDSPAWRRKIEGYYIYKEGTI